MPHNQSQWITHVIDGGWATDNGTTFYATPQNGELRIPWCQTLENIKFDPNGSIGKFIGTYQANPGPIKAPSVGGFIESSLTKYIYHYVRMGATLTGTAQKIAVVGNTVYTYTISENTRIGDLSGSLGPCHMTTFNDLLIIGNGTTSPKSWDQTTFQTLAGTPPGFSISTPHAGRHWAAGAAAVPSRLYYSAVGNPEDWVGAGSGSIDIDPGDGDIITALLSWKDQLWVFKGPNRLSIHRISGTDPSTDLTRKPFIYGISAANSDAIFKVGEDFAFWSPRGSCHSMTATDSYGDYSQSYLNYPILSWCRNPDNIAGSLSNTWQSVTDQSTGISYGLFDNGFLASIGGRKPKLIAMDWRFRGEGNPYPRFYQLTFDQFSALNLGPSSFDANQFVPLFGTPDGLIFEERSLNAKLYAHRGRSITSRVITPTLTYGPTYYKKTITAVSVDFVSLFGSNSGLTAALDFSYGGRGLPTQTLTLNSVGYVGLGDFTLDTDQLGDFGDNPNFREDVAGEFTDIKYTLVEDTPIQSSQGREAKINHFSALIINDGASTETV